MARTVTEKADVLPELAETFRSHGFEGASLAVISQRTGLGKGSLYHFFPAGKDAMAEAVLDEVDAWFRDEVYGPLRDADRPGHVRIEQMFASVASYFRAGQRICLFGAFALGPERDRFRNRVTGYFSDWTESLTVALEAAGHDDAAGLAEEVVAGIQGAIILARAQDDTTGFVRVLGRLQAQTRTIRRP